jgi:hypothetical protein
LPEAYAKENHDTAIKALAVFVDEILDVGGFKK